MDDKRPVYLEVGDAAPILEIGTIMVRQLADRGLLRIAATTRRGARLFTEDDVRALAAKRAKKK